MFLKYQTKCPHIDHCRQSTGKQTSKQIKYNNKTPRFSEKRSQIEKHGEPRQSADLNTKSENKIPFKIIWNSDVQSYWLNTIVLDIKCFRSSPQNIIHINTNTRHILIQTFMTSHIMSGASRLSF